VRFKLKQPWPDFLTFYVEATGAGWIVPKTYVERLGDEAYKKAPIAAGPYRFVSFTPGLEAHLGRRRYSIGARPRAKPRTVMSSIMRRRSGLMG